MEKFDSISHFLQSGGFNYRIFDMGRKVTPISNHDFQQLENQNELYPYPFLQKAWMGLLFWTGIAEEKEPVIWFLQFPIDEMGFLKQDARDGFLISLLEQAGKNIQSKQSGDMTSDELSESPYAFKPQPDRLAFFHALATKELAQQPSQYYQYAQEYLLGDAGYEQWQFLGLQGIADIVARLDQNGNEDTLSRAIGLMPKVPLENFCKALENVNPQGLLAQELAKRLELEINSDQIIDVQLVSALIRSISGIQPEQLRHNILLKVLNSAFGKEIEILASISGRAWNDLHSKQLLEVFISNLASQDQTAFNAILADLMMVPKMREPILEIMRSPERSDELSHLLSEFMKAINISA